MKKIIFVFLIVFLQTNCYGDKIYWERLSVGISANYQIPKGDFGKYWSDGSGAGVFSRYQIDDNLFLSGSLVVGYFTPAHTGERISIPHLWLASVSGGIQYDLYLRKNFWGIVGFGGSNHTFIFRGYPAKRLGSNYIESEVALYGEAGFSFRFDAIYRIDLLAGYCSIFSAPEEIPIWTINVRLFF